MFVLIFSCSYDEEADKVNQYQRLNLEGLEKIEIGKKLGSKQKWRFLLLTESPNTSQKCTSQFLSNLLAISLLIMIHARKAHHWKWKLQVVFFFAGPEPTLFGKPKFCCMRLHYRNEETSGYFHTLRAATRNPEDDGKGRMWFFNRPEKKTF